MRLSPGATHLHLRASSHFARRFKGRHQSGGRRSAGQSPSAQRAVAGGRAPVDFLGRLLRRIWHRMRPDAVGQVLPLPVLPPANRVVTVVSYHRCDVDATHEGARCYTLRAHAQARWRDCAGWAQSQARSA